MTKISTLMLIIRILAIVLICSIRGFGQELISVVAETNQGTIFLNSNYMKTDRLGVQRIEIVPIYTSFRDLFAWKWIKENVEYHFELFSGETYFVRASNKRRQWFRVFSYKTNFSEN